MGERIFRIHLPPGAEGKQGVELVDLVFTRFVESGWGDYRYEKNGSMYQVIVNNFWLSEGLKGMDKKPVCALMEGILKSLFVRAFDRQACVTEIECAAIGNTSDKFEISFP